MVVFVKKKYIGRGQDHKEIEQGSKYSRTDTRKGDTSKLAEKRASRSQGRIRQIRLLTLATLLSHHTFVPCLSSGNQT